MLVYSNQVGNLWGAGRRETAEAAQTAALETRASLTREKEASHAMARDARWACNTTDENTHDTGLLNLRPASLLQQPHATMPISDLDATGRAAETPLLCRQDIEAASCLARLFGSLLQEVGPEYRAAHPARVLRQLGAPELATHLSPGALRQLGQLKLSSRQTMDALAGTRLAGMLQQHFLQVGSHTGRVATQSSCSLQWACWCLATLQQHYYLQAGDHAG